MSVINFFKTGLQKAFLKSSRFICFLWGNWHARSLISILLLYWLLIAAFAAIYYKADQNSRFSSTFYKNEEYRHLLPVKRAFVFSDSLNKSRKIEAITSLGATSASNVIFKMDGYSVSNSTDWDKDRLPLKSWDIYRRFIPRAGYEPDPIRERIDDVIFNLVLDRKTPVDR